MFSLSRSIAFLVVLTMATGCTVTRPVTDDYQQYLANNAGGKFEAVKAAEQYYLSPATQQHRYEFRAATTGHANLWVVEFGKVLDATMQSKDVTDAFGRLAKAAMPSSGTGNTLVFDLQKYTFEDFGAHVTLTISVNNGNGEVFKKTYSASGKSQGAKMFFAGAFGMKNAVQQSTKIATDDIIARFIRDLKMSPAVASAK